MDDQPAWIKSTVLNLREVRLGHAGTLCKFALCPTEFDSTFPNQASGMSTSSDDGEARHRLTLGPGIGPPSFDWLSRATHTMPDTTVRTIVSCVQHITASIRLRASMSWIVPPLAFT